MILTTFSSTDLNDVAALGGVSEDPGAILKADALTTLIAKVELPEGYQAVFIIAGDSPSAVIFNAGELRVCGSLRVRLSFSVFY